MEFRDLYPHKDRFVKIKYFTNGYLLDMIIADVVLYNIQKYGWC